MAKVLMVKRLGSLYPVYDDAQDAMKRIGQGELVTVEVKKSRNIKFHQKFFAMLQIVLRNQEYYQSIDELLDVAKLSIGHCHTVRTKQGDVKIPDSISFAAMDDIAFAAFYDRAVTWVCQEVIPGLRQKDLDEEVEAELMAFGEMP